MKLLVLTRYGYRGASSRIRFHQYLPGLQAFGFTTEVFPFFDDQQLERRDRTGRYSFRGVMRSYARRIRALSGANGYDLIWLEYEAFPWWPRWFDQLFLLRRVPYVVEYDDAVFHRYDMHGNPLVRLALGRKIDSIMRGARIVIAGNCYLAARARAAGAPRVEILPSVVDLDRYRVRQAEKREAVFTIGWIGSSSTTRYLKQVLPQVADVCRDGRARIVAVGAAEASLADVGVTCVEWSAEREADALTTFDVGIMPLEDGPWEWGKCGYKIIQYMACGLPVVASPVGVNSQLIKDGVNGFLASRADDWARYLAILRDDPELRIRMGGIGRADVEARYCSRVTAPRLASLLSGAVARPS